jgi:peptidoglycan hydrolase-like protein with peptidoglycan-binding domain
VEIKPSRQLDIGLGQPGRGAVAQVEGGLLGIVVDARGRPLKLPDDTTERLKQLQQWLKALDINYAPPVSNNQ